MKPAMLCVTSPVEVELSNSAKKITWDNFLKNGSTHSANASTLPFIIRRCEQLNIAYILEAEPGIGYFIRRKIYDVPS